jgi:hypothetical protein
MAGAQIFEQKHPYMFTANQNPDGTWTIIARRYSAGGMFRKSRLESLTYTSATLPSSPKAAWRAASGS